MTSKPRVQAPAIDPIIPARFPAGPKVREWARQNGVSDWLAARLTRLSDNPSTFLEGLLHRPPRYIRVNPLRGGTDEVKQRLEAKGFQLSRSDLDSHILRLRQTPISPGATVEHMQGMTTPQDLASASAPLALDAKPGDVVADLAAAPGVKTLHIAGDMGAMGAIVAVEPEADRMRALRFNLERCGVASALLRQERAQDLPGEGWADKVLLDAPCTGEGTMPKDRNRRSAKPEEMVQLCAVQSEMVDAADRILRPGGTLVYATCTFGPEENEVQAQRLLDRGYKVEPLPFDRCSGTPLGKGITDWPGFTLDPSLVKARRFLPGIHPTMGFFVVKLRKPGDR
ncbi:MAG: RsmB/NOP family class I SAM-dependent RNA methyltransferase [Candidatus Thermoplasmatota archaeon]|jgi:NOL1/NOP2/sun family putative RNA methylase